MCLFKIFSIEVKILSKSEKVQKSIFFGMSNDNWKTTETQMVKIVDAYINTDLLL